MKKYQHGSGETWFTIAVFACMISMCSYSIHKDYVEQETRAANLKAQLGDDYQNYWHILPNTTPESLDKVQGLEGCVLINMERNHTLREVIRCENLAKIRIPGKFPRETTVIEK